MKHAIIILLILFSGALMDEKTYCLYGMRITFKGDVATAMDRADLALKVMFQTKMMNVNNLDIISNERRWDDGTIVKVLSQHGLDSALVYVPPKGFVRQKPGEDDLFQIVCPYWVVSDATFPIDGLLYFRGGYNLTGPYELISPYYKYRNSFRMDYYRGYTPYSYQDDDGEEHIIEWQVKKYTDPATQVFWDEIPWMSGGYSWDPVYCDVFDMDWVNDKPHRCERRTLINTYPPPYPDGPGWPDEQIGTQTLELYISGGPSIVQWSTQGELISIDPNISQSVSSGEVTTWSPPHAIDQTSPGKYSVLYQTRNRVSLGKNNGYDYCRTYTDHKIVFQGLGHKVEISEAEIADYRLTYHWDLSNYGWETSVDFETLLYKVKDTYVSLFAISIRPRPPGDPDNFQTLIGCAIEGGDFVVRDVTEGVEFLDEKRLIRAGLFGLLLRRGDPAIIHSAIE